MGPNETEGTAEAAEVRAVSFAAFYDQYVEDVYRYVHRRCRDHRLAEDVTQEAFMAAIRSGQDPSSIPISWLYTVARNQLVDILRRQSRYEAKLRLMAPDQAEGHDAQLSERLQVERALGKLSSDHRLVLTLHYMDGYTVPSLAEHLGRSVKSVEGLVTRARRALRAELDRGDVDDTQIGDGHVG